MLILSFKEGHDGAVVAIDHGKLLFSLEAEKDSFPRYNSLTAEILQFAAERVDRLPDVVAIGGWTKGIYSNAPASRTGYFGVGPDAISTETGRFFGRNVKVFSSTHERSHIMTGYGLAPFASGHPCYCLVWEGNIGSFYRIDERGRAKHLRQILSDPGNKYAFLFALADPKFPANKGLVRLQDAGKQMALTGFAAKRPANKDEQAIIDVILKQEQIIHTLGKDELTWSPFHNVGVESQPFKDVAARLSDAIFDRFYGYAAAEMREGLPLLITGGCALNCEWNRRWRECGLFPEVFVPPCPNDSGSALGTAIDAQHHYTGTARVSWNVYAGTAFVEDVGFDPARYHSRPLDFAEVARYLAEGSILGWARGQWEIGPRALGNRSILAAPFTAEMTRRLNTIKQRENYRPIAPICLADDAARWFSGSIPDPYMLYFSNVTSDRLKAVTHVDGSARVQTVTREQNAGIFDLLSAFRELTGFSVLCNTSLNFSGRGFINRTSDLIRYGDEHGLDGYVVENTFVTRRAPRR